MVAVTVRRDGTSEVVDFDSLLEVGSATEFIRSVKDVWGEGVLLKPNSNSALTARTPAPFPHGIYTFRPKAGSTC